MNYFNSSLHIHAINFLSGHDKAKGHIWVVGGAKYDNIQYTTYKLLNAIVI